MNVKANVKSRANRILKPLNRYHELSTESISEYVKLGAELRKGENCLGVYENLDGSPREMILITDLGLHLYNRSRWDFVAFGEIQSVHIPSQDKGEANNLEIRCSGGQIINIPVKGGSGRFRDAFEFLRFLNRVQADIRIHGSRS